MPPASRRRPARSARDSPPPSAWRIAERLPAARFGDDLVDHFTYVIAGDGCLMEGVSHEAIDLAGHLKLSKLIVLWDDNSISIDGPTTLATSTDQIARFAAAGWHVAHVDGHDPEAVAAGDRRRAGRPAAVADRLPHDHRLSARPASRARNPARRAARRRGDRRGARGARLAVSAFRSSGRRARRLARGRHGAARRRAKPGRRGSPPRPRRATSRPS